MKKNLLFAMSAVLLLMAGMVMTACSDDEVNGIIYKKEMPKISRSELNVLEIREVDGPTETCWLDNPICGIGERMLVNTAANEDIEDFPMKFTANIQNSLHFTGLHLGIENREHRNIEALEVGESYSTFHFNPFNKLSFSIYGETYSGVRGAWSGSIEVVDKRTDADSVTYITINIQDLETCAYDESNWTLHTYFLNGMIEFRVCENGLYPRPEGPVIDLESMRYPSDKLDFFMMDALHSSEFEGRRTFFSDEAVAEECLIINSEEEFRQAYKGDKELPSTGIDFDYCTLVIGRTYGEHGGVTYGGHELIDNGDSYQLNVTLNNNVNPDYCYTAAFTDIYFWNIYLKKEKKPVVFNRIRQDVTIDPFIDANNRIVGSWILEGYSDGDDRYADGGYHRVGEGYYGDKRFSIEFKADGTVVGRINDTNDFSCRYMVPYIGTRAYYEDAVEHGIINLWDWNITEVADDNLVSQKMMHISNATQIKLLLTYNLTLFVSPNEYYVFRRDNQ